MRIRLYKGITEEEMFEKIEAYIRLAEPYVNLYDDGRGPGPDRSSRLQLERMIHRLERDIAPFKKKRKRGELSIELLSAYETASNTLHYDTGLIPNLRNSSKNSEPENDTSTGINQQD
jgi:hypothetical protein